MQRRPCLPSLNRSSLQSGLEVQVYGSEISASKLSGGGGGGKAMAGDPKMTAQLQPKRHEGQGHGRSWIIFFFVRP